MELGRKMWPEKENPVWHKEQSERQKMGRARGERDEERDFTEWYLAGFPRGASQRIRRRNHDRLNCSQNNKPEGESRTDRSE